MSALNAQQSLLWDNPVLVKHVRSRLRPQHLFPSIAAVVILALLITWSAIATDSVRNGIAFGFLVSFQGAILLLGGAAQVSGAVAGAKEGGVLDFHRISPVRPLALALGFLLGGAVREYALFACTLPFSVVFVALGWPSPLAFVEIYGDLVLLGLLYHAAGLMAGLVTPKARGAGGGIVALVFFAHMTQLPPVSYFSLIPVFREALDLGRAEQLTFFGAQVPAVLLCALHQAPLFLFLMVAAVRRMRHDRAFFYSKPVAVLFHGVVAFLILGDVIGPSRIEVFGDAIGSDFAALTTAYGLLVAGLALSAAVTPGAGDFANGVRRARKQGLSRVSAWSDLASNRAPLAAFSALLILATVTAGWATGDMRLLTASFATAIVGACVILYFGSAKQAFDLLYRKSSASYFVLFLFLLWIVPLLVGGVAAASRLPEAVQQVVTGASPFAGLYMVQESVRKSEFSPGAAVAFGSSVVLAVTMLQLAFRAERRTANAAVKGRE